MASTKAVLKPLEWDEEQQRWSWPPEYVGDTHRIYKSSIAQMEDVLWTLVHQKDGTVHDKSGLATKKLQSLIANQDTKPGGFKQAVINLEALGLVERAMNERRVYRISLAIPVEQVPGTDPHVPAWSGPAQEQRIVEAVEEALHPDYIEVQRPETPPIEIPQPSQSALDTQRLAVALLDEVVRRASAEPDPGWAADRNHIADKLKKAEHRIVVLTKENEIAAGTLKALKVQLAEARRNIDGLEHNLRTALEAARELSEKAGITASQDTAAALARLITKIPGFDKEVT